VSAGGTPTPVYLRGVCWVPGGAREGKCRAEGPGLEPARPFRCRQEAGRGRGVRGLRGGQLVEGLSAFPRARGLCSGGAPSQRAGLGLFGPKRRLKAPQGARLRSRCQIPPPVSSAGPLRPRGPGWPGTWWSCGLGSALASRRR